MDKKGFMRRKKSSITVMMMMVEGECKISHVDKLRSALNFFYDARL